MTEFRLFYLVSKYDAKCEMFDYLAVTMGAD